MRALLPALLFGLVACGSDGGEPVTLSNTASPAGTATAAPPSTTSGTAPPPVTPADAGVVAPPPPPPPSVKITTESLTVGTATRSYVLAVPDTYSAAKTYPLVLALHGDYHDGASMREALRFEDTSGQGAIVAYPTGTNQSWQLYTPTDSDADLAFLVALVDALRARFTIGGAFGMGLSSGAFMVNQVACRRPSLFRGIISHSGGAPDEPNQTHDSWPGGYAKCSGQTSGVAVMVIHGKADGTVAYPSGTNTAEYWTTVNGCATTQSATSPSPCVRQDACPTDKPVVFCGIDGLDHALWSNAAGAAWGFVSSL